MNVTVLCTSPAVGGAERQAVYLVHEISRHTEWSCSLVALTQGRSQAITGAGEADAGLLASARSCIGADVVIAFNYHPMMLARLLPSSARIVSSIRTPKLGARSRHLLARMTKRRDSVTIFNSGSVAQEFRRRREVDDDRIRIVPNIVVPQAHCDAKTASPRRDETFTWVFVGRNHEAKGVDALRRVLARLDVSSGRNRRLIILGRGHEEWIGRAPLSKKTEIEYRGEVVDVASHLADADALLMTSRWEGSPNAVLEAMAAGLPCLATDVGGIRDIPGGNGVVVVDPSVDQLVNESQRIEAMERADRARVGRAGVEYIKTHHAAEVVWPQWRDVISQR